MGLRLLGSYSSVDTVVLARCETCGHEWRARPSTVFEGHGCPECGKKKIGDSRKLHMDEIAIRFAKQKLELIGAYTTGREKSKTRCLRCGHEWWVVPYDVFSGSGCPKCNLHGGEGEDRIRELFEEVTGWPFEKARPLWLKGRGRHPLELDGYNEEHRVAFEYQGEQHYQPLYGQKALSKLKKNDDRKRMLCRRYGVHLIRVPFWKRDAREFIRSKLAHAGVVVGQRSLPPPSLER